MRPRTNKTCSGFRVQGLGLEIQTYILLSILLLICKLLICKIQFNVKIPFTIYKFFHLIYIVYKISRSIAVNKCLCKPPQNSVEYGSEPSSKAKTDIIVQMHMHIFLGRGIRLAMYLNLCQRVTKPYLTANSKSKTKKMRKKKQL